jgi:hypothetical protein
VNPYTHVLISLGIVLALPAFCNAQMNAVGQYAGSYSNSRGESGAASLVIEEDNGTVRGKWDGDPFSGTRAGNAITFELRNVANCRDYQARVEFANGGNAATLTYTVQDRCRQPATYAGTEKLTRQGGTSRAPADVPQMNIVGRYTGTYTNSRNESGAAELVIDKVNGTFQGKWDGDPVSGTRTGNSVTFELRNIAGCRDYQAQVEFANGGNTATLTYTVRDRCRQPATYAGTEKLTRQGTVSPQLPPATGVRYRMENLSYNQPDLYVSPRNYHDFMIDFSNCSVREMNQESDQGRERVQISVCRGNRRLTFTTSTDGGTPVEYDFAFRDGGRIAAGAWRQGGSFGPSVGGVYGPDAEWQTR